MTTRHTCGLPRPVVPVSPRRPVQSRRPQLPAAVAPGLIGALSSPVLTRPSSQSSFTPSSRSRLAVVQVLHLSSRRGATRHPGVRWVHPVARCCLPSLIPPFPVAACPPSRIQPRVLPFPANPPRWPSSPRRWLRFGFPSSSALPPPGSVWPASPCRDSSARKLPG
jgi:hypothetical protein